MRRIAATVVARRAGRLRCEPAVLNAGGSAQVNAVSCVAAGTAALNADGYAAVTTASCHSVGGSNHYHAYVVRETSGVWGAAIEVPGIDSSAAVNTVSCSAADECAAGGYYEDASLTAQAFLVENAAPCVVPHLVGKTPSAAENLLSAAHCGVGAIKKVSAKTKSGRVVAQSPRPGKHLRAGSDVALTVSKGRK